MSERLTDEQLREWRARYPEEPYAGHWSGKALIDELLALRARVAQLEAARPSDINTLDDVVRVLGIENDSVTPAEKVEELFQTITKLHDRNAALEGTCRSAGLCMSCLYGAPDPIGCTDCLGTGWDGGDPHSQIEVLEARVAQLEAALEKIGASQPWVTLSGKTRKEYERDDAGLADYWSDLAKEYQEVAIAALKDAPNE